MPADDPTSAAHSLGTAPNRRWTVDEVARMQSDAAAAASPGSAASDVAPLNEGSTSTTPSQAQGVSGRYRARGGEVEIEVRVDVDGVRPSRRVSGDFFRRTGGTLSYTGSFIVNTPNLTVANGEVVIEGEGVFSFQSGSPRLRLTIPLTGPVTPRAQATVQFLTPTGIPGAAYGCEFESTFFRTLEFEIDVVEGISPFQSFDTARLPSGGPPRVLSVPAAYAEAGIEMIQVSGAAVPIAGAGDDRIWTNRELHDAMVNQFSRWGADPAWRVWLVAATMHEEGPSLRGIMFDTEKRQGCAIFHDVVAGTDDRAIRGMLRTYMHELGHCFNLYHSHQREFMHPPRPNRLDALSWMHYPAYFRSGSLSGEAAYWKAFPYQFDDDEIIHLRHGFRNAVIPGGQPFGLGAADVDPGTFADPVEDETGLRLELRGPDKLLLGTPVVVEIKLSLTGPKPLMVNTALHPNKGYVQIGISRLDGKTVAYRPMITQCVEPTLLQLDESLPALYDSAYIGYGKDGFYFGSPGQYELRAIYRAHDGSVVFSNRLRLQIKAPISAQDEEVADLFFGDDQGKLLYLLGSDSEGLAGGRRAFARVQEKYAQHPMTSYARLVEGMNCSRPFKHISDRTVVSRPADRSKSDELLSRVVDVTVQSAAVEANPTADSTPPATPRLDNISLNMVMQRLTRVRKEAGDDRAAVDTARQMYDFFVHVEKVPEPVQQRILTQIGRIIGEEQAAALKRGETA